MAAEGSGEGVVPDSALPGSLRSLVQSMLDPFNLLRAVRGPTGGIADFTVVEANSAAAAFNGLPVEEFVGCSLTELYPELRSNGLFAHYVRVVESGTTLELDEWELPFPDGPRYFDIRGAKVGDGLSVGWRDVTERRNRARAIEESEHRFRLLSENSGDAILLSDGATRLYWVSDSITHLLGWQPAELIGRRAAEFIHPDDLPDVISDVQSSEESGETVHLRCRWRRPDGSYRWVDAVGQPFIDDAAGETRRVVRLRDVQAEVDARTALEKSEDRHRRITASLSEGVLVLDPDGRITQANAAAEEILGLSFDQLTGRTPLDARWAAIHRDGSPFPGDTHPAAITIATGATVRDTLMGIRTPDGALRWLIVNSAPLPEPDSSATGAVASFVDVTAVVTAEDRAQSERDRLRLVLESSQLATWDWNMQTGETTFSERWAEIIGYTLAELEPISIDTWVRLCHPGDLSASDALIQAHARGETDFYELECRMRHRDGHWVWVLDRGQIVEWDGDGRPMRMAGTHEDITRRRALMDALASSESRFRTMVESLGEGLVVHAFDGRITDANAAACRMLGLGIDELRGLVPVDDRWHAVDENGDDLPGERHPAAVTLTTGEPVRDVVMGVHRPDGSRVWLLVSSIPFPDHDGKTGAVATFSDITRMRQLTVDRDALLQRTHLVLEASRLGLWDWDVSTNIVTVDERWRAIIGRPAASPATLSYEEFESLVHPDDLPGVLQRLAEHTTDSTARYDATFRMRHDDGHWVWVRARGRITARAADGSALQVTGTHEDVSQERQMLGAIMLSEERLRAAMESSPVAMAIVDMDRAFLKVNPALCHLLDREREWLETHGVGDVLDGPDDALDQRMRADVRMDPRRPQSREHRVVRGDGTHLWIDHSIALIPATETTPATYVSTFTDITATREQWRELRLQANYDPLTELLNRRELASRADYLLDRATRTGSNLAVLFIDVDQLKPVNDSIGHFAGDDVLREIASRVRAGVRATDVVARYGGDEFVVLLPDIHDVEDAFRVAESIRTAAIRPVMVSGQPVAVTLSIGVALTSPGDHVETAFQRADAALYRAKGAGRNRVTVFDPDIDTMTSDRRAT